MNWFFILTLSLPPTLIVIHHILRTLPDSSPSIIQGVFDRVTVTRSSEGIPKIECESLDDFFFTLGYAHAQDRLWQMDILRRRAEGSLSEFLGASYLESDLFAINMRFKYKAQTLSGLSAKGQYYFKRYAQGINAYAEHSYLPIDYFLTWNKWRRWTMGDSLTIWRYFSFVNSNRASDDILRSQLLNMFGSSFDVLPVDEGQVFLNYFTIDSHELPGELYRDTSLNLDKEEGFSGVFNDLGLNDSGFTSSVFVISGEFTKSGKPILSSDFYSKHHRLIHLVQGSWLQEKISGGLIPGVPYFLFGSNSKITWSLSPLRSKTIQISTNLASATSLTHIAEEVKIRKSKPTKVEFSCSETGCSLINSPNLFIKWASDQVLDQSFDGFIDLMTGFSVRSVRRALDKVNIGSFGFALATIEGDIAYQVIGAHPLQEKMLNGIVDIAKNPIYSKLIKFEDLPYTVNPSKGFIISSDNFPTTSIYKHFQSLGMDFTGHKGKRMDENINNLIKKRTKITINELTKVDSQEFSSMAHKILKTLIDITGSNDIKKEFEGWDFEFSSESRQAGLFLIWFSKIVEVFGEKLPRLVKSQGFRSLVAKQIEVKDYQSICAILRTECSVNMFKNTFFDALAVVSGKNWKEVLDLKYSHEGFEKSSFRWLWEYELPVKTAEINPYFNSSGRIWEDLQILQSRFILDLGKEDAGIWGLTTGQSGNLFSDYYKDFSKLFSVGLPHIK